MFPFTKESREKARQEKLQREKEEEIEDQAIREQVRVAFSANKNLLADVTNERLIMLALAKVLNPGLGSFDLGVTNFRETELAKELYKRAKAD